LLAEGEVYWAAVARVEELLPALLPGVAALPSERGHAPMQAPLPSLPKQQQQQQPHDLHEGGKQAGGSSMVAALAADGDPNPDGKVLPNPAPPAAALPAPPAPSAPAPPATAAPADAAPADAAPAAPAHAATAPAAPAPPAPAAPVATAAPAHAAEACPDPSAALLALLLAAPALYVLLGFRLTAGSAAGRGLAALPSVRECEAAFEARHAPPGNASVLSVGARALSKHTHRDLRGEWWPALTGSEANKNQVARGSLRRLLAGALWLNCHQLPPFEAPKFVLEIRNEQGYGARWAVEEATVASEASPRKVEGTPRPHDCTAGGASAAAAAAAAAVSVAADAVTAAAVAATAAAGPPTAMQETALTAVSSGSSPIPSQLTVSATVT
ncbi:hypothetical protein Agub_g14971, partial [Astrephomene gubernaculifera]